MDLWKEMNMEWKLKREKALILPSKRLMRGTEKKSMLPLMKIKKQEKRAKDKESVTEVEKRVED